jgi:hypothetical protein
VSKPPLIRLALTRDPPSPASGRSEGHSPISLLPLAGEAGAKRRMRAFLWPHAKAVPVLAGEGGRRVPQSKAIARDEGQRTPHPTNKNGPLARAVLVIQAKPGLEAPDRDNIQRGILDGVLFTLVRSFQTQGKLGNRCVVQTTTNCVLVIETLVVGVSTTQFS